TRLGKRLEAIVGGRRWWIGHRESSWDDGDRTALEQAIAQLSNAATIEYHVIPPCSAHARTCALSMPFSVFPWSFQSSPSECRAARRGGGFAKLVRLDSGKVG